MNDDKRKLLDRIRKKKNVSVVFFFLVRRWLLSWSNLINAYYVKALLQIKI